MIVETLLDKVVITSENGGVEAAYCLLYWPKK